ncbi:AmmeMemoRadiSam system radical SAM enzyme [Candidatus Poribacteria bacterium]|nr:AmmeMemoRadiSam system radical SAM enzyme [Candidatus Poribacteria bacterium]
MSSKTRREFIQELIGGAAFLPLVSLPFSLSTATAIGPKVDENHIFVVKEAMYYEKLAEGEVKCKLCPKECKVGDKERGWCGVRENSKGTYYTLVHSNPCSVHIDPIEKKPFFHYLPASLAFSISTAGCNLNCKYCQNWQISQRRPEQTNNSYLPPDEVVRKAKEYGCQSIGYTYAEPAVFYEYLLDTSIAAHKADVRAVVVSAGYIQTEPLKRLCETVDAIKIDLKAYNDKFYREICHGTLQPVLDTLKSLKKTGVWYEVVDLVVPTLNDTENELKNLARWVVDNLGVNVPLHFSRFYPTYQLKNLPPTPMETLEQARHIARDEGLHYVYLGNVRPDHEGNNTYCPQCKNLVIQRKGLFVVQNNVVDGKCNKCKNEIPGVWF